MSAQGCFFVILTVCVYVILTYVLCLYCRVIWDRYARGDVTTPTDTSTNGENFESMDSRYTFTVV